MSWRGRRFRGHALVKLHHFVFINRLPSSAVVKQVRKVLVHRKQDIVNVVLVEQFQRLLNGIDLQIVVENATVSKNVRATIAEGLYRRRIKLNVPAEVVPVEQTARDPLLLHEIEGIPREYGVDTALEF